MRGLNMKTKDKILIEALSLFSVSGFSGVSVRDIAKAVGIRESAIYKHYKNKQQLFDRGSDARKRTGGMEVLLR